MGSKQVKFQSKNKENGKKDAEPKLKLDEVLEKKYNRTCPYKCLDCQKNSRLRRCEDVENIPQVTDDKYEHNDSTPVGSTLLSHPPSATPNWRCLIFKFLCGPNFLSFFFN